MSPRFSIIIPVYNVAPYLRECLDSLLAQTFADWEAVCVDDGSTDGGGAILDEYAARDARFRVFHQPNAGVSAARNFALDNTRGEWIGFLDADDSISSGWLAAAAAEQTDLSVDWVRLAWTDCEVGGRVEQHIPAPGGRRSFSGGETLAVGWSLVARCGFPWVNFYRRAAIEGVRFPCGVRVREDAIFCFEAASRAGGLRIADCVGYMRRIHCGSAMSCDRRRDDSVKTLSAYLDIWRRFDGGTGCLSRNAEIASASTLWVSKDVKQWLAGCTARIRADTLAVWRLVWRLHAAGACGLWVGRTFAGRLRWLLFMLVPCGALFARKRNKESATHG